MSDVQVVDRNEARAVENRLRAVREIAKAVHELQVTGFDPVLALLDKAAKLDASLHERATLVRDVVHSNAVPALIASGEITDEVLASFRQAAPSPDEIARLTTAVQHAVSAILRDAVTATIAAGPAVFANLVKVADKAVADAGKVAAKMLPNGRTYVPQDEKVALADGVVQSDLDALTAAYGRYSAAHRAAPLLRELGAIPTAKGQPPVFFQDARPWVAVPPGYTTMSRPLRLASAILNGARPGLYGPDEIEAHVNAWHAERGELAAAHERAKGAADKAARAHAQAARQWELDGGPELAAAAREGDKAAARKVDQLRGSIAAAQLAHTKASAELDRASRALRACRA